MGEKETVIDDIPTILPPAKQLEQGSEERTQQQMYSLITWYFCMHVFIEFLSVSRSESDEGDESVKGEVSPPPSPSQPQPPRERKPWPS